MNFRKSTLSLLTVVSVVAVIVFQIMGVTTSDFTQQIIAGIVGAYIGSRLPNTVPEEKYNPVIKDNLTTDPELEFLASKYNADDTSTQ